MRRAAVGVLRSARRPSVRSSQRVGRPAGQVYPSYHGQNTRAVSSRRERFHPHLLTSSMYFRNFSLALVSTLVASGAYFAYRGGPEKVLQADASNPFSTAVQQSKGFSTATSFANTASQPSPSIAEEAVQATRRALVIDADQIYKGTIVGDGPLSKTTDDYGRKILEMVTPDQATERLRRNEESFLVGRGKGVVRYDVVQLPSNDPIEDDHAEKIVEFPKPGSSSNDWMFWGVFDGHSGWTTSAKLRQALISYVARELNTTYASAHKTQASLPTPSSIDAAIKRGFVALDTSIIHDSVAEVLKSQHKPQAASLLAPAMSGSCALLSFYDTASKTLRVACTGDSRAILGRRSLQNPAKWVSMPLSIDQTGANKDEADRLRAEHPNEPNVVANGRVLGGLEPTRAFGDAFYKWPRELQEKLKSEFLGRTPDRRIQSPPYVTAEPVVTTTQVQPENGDFVVMATDGLWEMLTNDEVVGLVGQWLEQHPEAQRTQGKNFTEKQSGVMGGQPSDTTSKQAQSWLRSWFSTSQRKNLPIDENSPNAQEDQSGQRAPIRQQQWGLPPSTSPSQSTPSSDRFVCEDQNAATHLIRNALGGGDRDMVCALLTLPSPYSRRYRDDLTVEVIFFGDAPADASGVSGGIMINEAATAKAIDHDRPRL